MEREKSRSIEYICFDFENPFLYQVNWNYPGVFSSDFHRRPEYSHDSDFIGVWILKYK